MAVARCTPAGSTRPPNLTVTGSASTVVADGTATVTITVAGATASVTLATTQGTWLDSGRAATNLAGNGSAILVTCDARTDLNCGGTVQITAAASNGANGTLQLTFGGQRCVDYPELCGDGMDNNCDGKADCADSTCAGKVCGDNGKMCSNSACLCTGGGGKGQVDGGETVCDDGYDNDCDGLIDCGETACRPVGNGVGKFCDALGHTCSPLQNGVSTCTICTVKADGGTPQGIETLCADNQDNDCDGTLDCQDPDCSGSPCSVTGKICTNSICSCPGSSPETACNDGKDNDCNGLIDCKDQGCQAFGGSPAASCGANGLVCTGSGTSGTCSCSGNNGTIQTSEGTGGDAGVPTCGDSFDNDCDSYVDCQDVNCRAVPLSDGGMIAGKDCSKPNGTSPTVGMRCDAAGQCICPSGQPSEVSCSDNLDNDCDGKADCADDNCNGLSCGNYGLVCNGQSCSCPSGSIENCADRLDNDCDGKVDCADLACVAGTPCDSTSANYQCSAAGVCADSSSNFSLQLVATPSRIAANGLATSTITATLKNGASPEQLKTIQFMVESPSVGSVAPTSGDTNGQGQTGTVYTSASSSGGLQTVKGSYFTGTAWVDGYVVIDTPQLGQVKFVRQQYSIMGVKFSSYQESNEIVFQVLDSKGAPYPAGLQVTFTHAPAGGSFIGSTPNCTPTACTATAITDATGTVKVTLHSGTRASAVEVKAQATAGGVPGEATASNIAIVGARASGSEIAINCTPRNVAAFFDNNCLNSFVPVTVNCTVTLGDRFKNVLGVSTQTTFSTEAGLAGSPQLTDKDGVAKGTVSVGNAKLPVDVDPFTGEWNLTYNSGCGVKTHNPRDGLVTIIASANGEEGFVDGSNGLPSNGTYDLGENFIDIGEPFIDANDNNVRDANETYLDSNNNGLWDGPNGAWDSNKVIWAETRITYSGHATVSYNSLTGEFEHSRWFQSGTVPPESGPTLPPTFAVLSSETTGGTATAQSFWVYFADKNFNQLNAQTTYSVGVIRGGVSAKYTFMPTVVDNIGMGFTQQFCSTQSGGTCSNTCQAAPCYVVTNVGSFSYGNYGVVEIKGGSAPASDAEVRAEAKYNNVSIGLSITGVCQ
jgi:hypothetical protein